MRVDLSLLLLLFFPPPPQEKMLRDPPLPSHTRSTPELTSKARFNARGILVFCNVTSLHLYRMADITLIKNIVDDLFFYFFLAMK